MPKDFDDDLEIIDGDVAEEAYVEQSESLVKAPTTAVAKESPMSMIDFNAIDLGLSGSAVIVAETGTKVSRFLSRESNSPPPRRERVSVILDKVVIVKTHFIEDVGSIICSGSLCCDELGLPSVRYLFPVVHYENTDKKGTPMSAEIDLKIRRQGTATKSSLQSSRTKDPLSQFDLVVTCNMKGTRRSPSQKRGDAKWKKSKKVAVRSRKAEEGRKESDSTVR